MHRFLLPVLLTLVSCGRNGLVAPSQIPLADPYILCHEGRYYAYGTGEPGFRVYVSDDLRHWEKRGIALDVEKSWGTMNFWAPEVHFIASKGLFYLSYSAEEHICIATSDNPEGPFVQDEIRPVREEKGIDDTIFIDDDGTPYLFFVRFTGGNVIWAAEMEEDFKSVREETLTECIRTSEPWESVAGKIAEGPSVFKYGDTYYLIYSANDCRSQDYGIGFATASSPLGPWTKYTGNPIFHRSFPNAGGLVGIGHGAPFHDRKGKLMYVFHAHQNDSVMHPRMMYVNSNLKINRHGILSLPGKVISPEVRE
ncbi:MAG: glycoside hydrolase family 43 protein [Bacteroidales bacterium]|nr:glycoside hydrolase family 43 protein [Bacteroidales bacterium]